MLIEGVAGAFVQIHSLLPNPTRVELIGEGVVDPIGKRVFLSRALTTRELVYAVQIVCGRHRGRVRCGADRAACAPSTSDCR